MDFSTKLRNLRIQRGLTQMELAEKLGTSQAAITAYESRRREPNFETIRKIAEVFRVPMSSLLPNDDNVSEDYISNVAEALHQNPKLRLLFDRTKFMSEEDLDAVLGVVSAIAKERN